MTECERCPGDSGILKLYSRRLKHLQLVPFSGASCGAFDGVQSFAVDIREAD